MASYVVDIKDLSGSTVIGDVAVEQLEYGQALNAPGAAELTFPLDAFTPAQVAPGTREVTINREGTAVWGGYVWAAAVDVAQQTVRLACEGYYSMLRYRTINETRAYNAVDQHAIAWDLIAYTQSQPNGNLGITDGSSPSGVTRKRLYCCHERVVVAAAIEELAYAEGGFDFWITPAKVWMTASPRRGSLSAQTFDTGSGPGDATNIWALSYDVDAAEVYTEVSVIPETDYCVDIDVIRSNTISTYLLRQATLNAGRGVKDAADRIDQGQEWLRLHRNPRWTMRLDTGDLPFDPPGYEVGDTVTVSSSHGYATFSQAFRVLAWRVRVEEGQETASLELDSVVS